MQASRHILPRNAAPCFPRSSCETSGRSRSSARPSWSKRGTSEIPSPWDAEEIANAARIEADPSLSSTRIGPGGGSIIVILATDAPLLPHQCERLAQRATLGLGRMGSIASNGSGDIFIAFSTGNRVPMSTTTAVDVRTLPAGEMTVMFDAVAEAVEEAIWNALCAAETMTGRNGNTVHGLPSELLGDALGLS